MHLPSENMGLYAQVAQNENQEMNTKKAYFGSKVMNEIFVLRSN